MNPHLVNVTSNITGTLQEKESSRLPEEDEIIQRLRRDFPAAMEKEIEHIVKLIEEGKLNNVKWNSQDLKLSGDITVDQKNWQLIIEFKKGLNGIELGTLISGQDEEYGL